MTRRHVSELVGLIHIKPRKLADQRGFFSETYSAHKLAEMGFARPFIQDNHALSHDAGTVRGMHFQSPPFAQDKLVRVVRGAIFDVALDLRVGSPTYGDHAVATLSAANWEQLLVPVGFAHGYATLEDETEVIYKVTAPYAPEHDHGFRWSDPATAIAWPVSPETALLSDKDRAAPLLADIVNPFVFAAP